MKRARDKFHDYSDQNDDELDDERIVRKKSKGQIKQERYDDSDEDFSPYVKPRGANNIQSVSKLTENDKVPNQQRAEKMTEIEEDQFIGIVLKYFTTIESKTTASGITAGTESSNNTKKQNGWIKIQDEFVKQTSKNRSTESLKTKWKNVKALAKKRKALSAAMNKTGGGTLSNIERRVVDSLLYEDVASRLGIAAEGLLPRLDSDANAEELIEPPTKRLANVMKSPEQNEYNTSHLRTETSLEQSHTSASHWQRDMSHLNPEKISNKQLTEKHSNIMQQSDLENGHGTQDVNTKKVAFKSHSSAPKSSLQLQSHNSLDRRQSSPGMDLQKTSSRHNLLKERNYNDTFVRQKNYRQLDVDKQLNMFEQNLDAQKQNAELQSKYLKLQIVVAEKKLQKLNAELKLIEVETQKQTELSRIEIKKQKIFAQMECVAKQRDLGLKRIVQPQQQQQQQRQQQ